MQKARTIQERQTEIKVGEGKSTRRAEGGARKADSAKGSRARALQEMGTRTEHSSPIEVCIISLPAATIENPAGRSGRNRCPRSRAGLSNGETWALFVPYTELLATQSQQLPHLAQIERKSKPPARWEQFYLRAHIGILHRVCYTASKFEGNPASYANILLLQSTYRRKRFFAWTTGSHEEPPTPASSHSRL